MIPRTSVPAARSVTHPVASADRRRLAAYYTDPDAAHYLCVSTVIPWLMRGFPSRSTSPEAAGWGNRDPAALAADWIRTEADEEQLIRLWRRLQSIRVLDPTCGDGVFLVTALHVLEPLWDAAAQRLAAFGAPEEVVALGLQHAVRRRKAVRRRIIERNLFGCDLDPQAIRACEARLAEEGGIPVRANLAAGNAAINPPQFGGASPGRGFDVVIGNPPFIGARAVSYRPAGLKTGNCPNVYAWVVEQSLRLLTDGGRLGMVLPISATCGPEYRPLAELYLRHDCWISTYSNRPARLFDGVEQRIALLITAPPGAREPELWTTAYQHWYQSERDTLFAGLTYTRGRLYEGMPAKLGSPAAVGAFKRLTGAPLREWSAPGEASVWLHDGPTYWVRALPFRPAGERLSSHYHRIPAPTEECSLALAAVLSSSTFYFWFKAVGNGRDLGRREWERFPIGWPAAGRRRRLAELGAELGDRLRGGARRRRRHYPGGPVDYAEFYPAEAADVIDRIDGALAEHYHLSDEERDYIRGLDRKYRLGKRIDGGE